MPTKRIYGLILVSILLAHPALGLIRLWGAKTLGTKPEGSIAYHAAEIIEVLS